MSENKFTPDIENILENIRLNSIILSKAHKKRYLFLKDTLKYYRLPVIIISSLNSVISIGTQPFIDQKYISITSCLLALMCGIIGSIELYFGINSQMEVEAKSNNDYYILATDIYKMLSLNTLNRHIDGRGYLDECYARYVKLFETSCVVIKHIDDKLTPIPKSLVSLLSISSKDDSSIDTDNEKSKDSNI